MNAKDLNQEPPRSPHQRIRDYVILARTLDKCRASLNGTLGGYHFNCPLDNMLFDFKGIKAEAFLEKVKSGATDEEMGQWLDQNGSVQTAGSISSWSQSLDSYLPFRNPDKKDWFVEQCKPLNLDPAHTTLFAFLEADDKASFPNFTPTARDPHNWDLSMVETAPGNRQSSIKATTHS